MSTRLELFPGSAGVPPAGVEMINPDRSCQLGVAVCEDFWNDKTFWKERLYANDPADEVQQARFPGLDQFLPGGPVPATAAQREEFAGHGVFVAGQVFSLREPLQVQTPPRATWFNGASVFGKAPLAFSPTAVYFGVTLRSLGSVIRGANRGQHNQSLDLTGAAFCFPVASRQFDSIL